MKEIDKITIHKKSHGIGITVYQHLVIAMVSMPLMESARFLQQGGVQAERRGLQDLMKGIFNEDFAGKMIFHSEEEYNAYLISKGLQVNSGGGHYSKNTIFELNQSNFEESLEMVLKHIKTKSDDYEKRKSPNKKNIVKKLFDKYFNNK